jgi:putative flippase GtrA
LTSSGDRFARLCAAVVRRLPPRLSRLVAPSLVGFALINGFTFGVDLLVLTLLRDGLAWPIAAAVTAGYLIALGLSFVLNRTLNFHSHGPVGRQTLLYALVISINFGLVVLGLGAGLAALGVEYHLARLVAGAGEGAFMYCAMRWVLFAPTSRRTP